MVVISNGFHKMHLATAAREASDRGLLDLAITGVYPTAATVRALKWLGLAQSGRLHRLLQRDEGIPAEGLEAIFTPELIDEAARLVSRAPGLSQAYPTLAAITYRLYGRLAGRRMRRAPGASIYHFRAGFGGASIARARRLGMVVLCDHALVHPYYLEHLVEHRGRLPESGEQRERLNRGESGVDALGRAVLADIERSDAVLANSDFVKGTFVAAGWPADRVWVAYTGVDDNFLAIEDVPVRRREPASGALPLVFASRFERRKGAEILIEALESLAGTVDWNLTVAGPVSEDIGAAHREFLAGERVRVLGSLSRPEFKRRLLDHPVFVFPTYAEGSARAVFDALACGCYTITTPNAGSIVEDGVHGALVPPGDVDALAAAIVAADRDREAVAAIGNRNAELVRERYRQKDYGDALERVYREVLSGLGSSPPNR